MHQVLPVGPPNRRDFMRRGAVAFLLAASVSACDVLSTTPAGESGTGARNPSDGAREKGKEAPSLTEEVKAGRLPAVDQRLPDNPLVVQPTESIGVYGGTWNLCVGTADGGFPYMNLAYDGLARWNADWTEIVPNLAESWDVNQDGREYVFRLRQGVKWSDGQPFTADDIAFAYQDVLLNEELYPAIPAWLASRSGEPAALEKLDTHTVRFRFSEPNGLFLRYVAGYDGQLLSSIPRHYFSQFHESYGTDVEELAEEEGFDNWSQLFFGKGGAGIADIARWQNPEAPTLAAWQLTQPMTAQLRLVAHRNPYYWKTDPEGSQLPYLDRAVIEVIKEPQVAILQASEGRFTLLPDEFAAVRNKPVLAQNRDRGDYHFIDAPQSNMNNAILVFNLTHKDARKRELFRNRDFRIGLSHAINRPELIASVLQRQGEPWQISPLQDSTFFDERLAKQFTAYDVDRANSHLDRAGYAAKDGDGFRLDRDGRRISFSLQVRVDSISTWADTAELIIGYWREVGIDANLVTGTSELILARVDANNHDVTMDDGYPGLDDALLDPVWYFPSHAGCQWAPRWGRWYASRGSEGEEPIPAVRRQMEIYDQIKVTADPAEQQRLFKDLLRIAQEEFYIIGTSRPVGSYSIVQNDFHNVPDTMYHSIAFPTPGYTKPEQYYRNAQGS